MPAPFAIALLVMSATLAAPVPKDKAKELYFPTTVGAKRVMVTNRGDTTRETTETVTQVEEKDGVYTVTLERDAGPGPVAAASQVFEVSAKGVSRLTSGGVKIATPQPLFKSGGKVGDTWESELTIPGSTSIKFKYKLGAEEEVEVPAGKFKAVRVEAESEQGGATRQTTAWYAPVVGLIKTEVELGGRKMVQELKSFTPGKGDKKDLPKKDK